MVPLIQWVPSVITAAWGCGDVHLLSHFANCSSSLLKLWYASGLTFLLFILNTVVGQSYQAAVRLVLSWRMSKDFCQATSVCCSGFLRLSPWRHLGLLQWSLLAAIQVPPWSLVESLAPSLIRLLLAILNYCPSGPKVMAERGSWWSK